MKGNKLLVGFGVAVIGIAAILWFSRSAQEGSDLDAVPGKASSATLQSGAAELESEVLAGELPQQEFDSALEGAATGENPTTSECPLEPALPSVSDIEVASCEHPFGIAKVLEQELRDPGWANDMEAQIRDLIDETEGLEAVRLNMECRMTACGVLLVFTVGAEYRQRQAIVTKLTDSLKETLGFRMWGLTASGPEDGRQVATIALMRAAGREQYQPERPTLPALPGVSGFDIPLTGLAEFDNEQPARRLADEVHDPVWSRPMESRVLSAASAALNSENASQVEVTCRSTMCGIALRYPPDSDPNVDGIQDRLAEALGFERALVRRYPNPSGMMVTIYLRNAGR